MKGKYALSFSKINKKEFDASMSKSGEHLRKTHIEQIKGVKLLKNINE
jgi:hypothetical protein